MIGMLTRDQADRVYDILVEECGAREAERLPFILYMTEPHPYGFKLGGVIRRLREAHEISQSELARRLGEKPNAVNRWESGRYRPSAYDLVKIGKCFAVKPHDLIGWIE